MPAYAVSVGGGPAAHGANSSSMASASCGEPGRTTRAWPPRAIACSSGRRARRECGAQVFQGRRRGRSWRQRFGDRQQARPQARPAAGHRRTQHQRHAHGVGQRPGGVQRLGIGRVAGHQQHRRRRSRHLRERCDQAGGEAVVVGADAGGRVVAAHGDVPVAGRRVVHRVREAGRRHQPVGPGGMRQRLAQGVAVGAVAAGGGEHRGQGGRVAPAALQAASATLRAVFTAAPARRRSAAGRRCGGGTRDGAATAGASPRSTGCASSQSRAGPDPAARCPARSAPAAWLMRPQNQAGVGAAEAEGIGSARGAGAASGWPAGSGCPAGGIALAHVEAAGHQAVAQRQQR